MSFKSHLQNPLEKKTKTENDYHIRGMSCNSKEQRSWFLEQKRICHGCCIAKRGSQRASGKTMGIFLVRSESHLDWQELALPPLSLNLSKSLSISLFFSPFSLRFFFFLFGFLPSSLVFFFLLWLLPPLLFLSGSFFPSCSLLFSSRIFLAPPFFFCFFFAFLSSTTLPKTFLHFPCFMGKWR